ncbi:MAG: hypothetical protein M1570_19075 [Chloroflexi bacterium]|nr:hypothetical protein [Chloroflexota bacterium]
MAKYSRLISLVGAAIAIVFFIAFAALTKTKPESWNDISRIAAVESLVERGTWTIDASPWLDATQDKVLLNGHFYSDKMPLMTLLGAGAYTILHDGWGMSLAPDCFQAAGACAYPWLTRILVGLPVALMLWLFYDFARRQRAPLWAALVGTAALGAGTMLFPYALVFNHHAPAAASLFASFYLLTRRTAWRGGLVLAGLLATLAISFDVLSGIVAAVMFGVALARYRGGVVYFALGAAVPIVITALLDYQIARTVIPPYMITNGYNYPGSAFPATFGGNGTPDDYAAYAFRMFLGGKGLFAYNPLLLLAIAGALVVALNRRHPLWIEGVFSAAGFLLLCAYLATETGNYGGTGYGERWFIVAIPLLYAFLFFIPPLNAETAKSAAWVVFVPFLALSVVSALQGSQAPWHDWLPPLQVTRQAQFPIFGFKWNGL